MSFCAVYYEGMLVHIALDIACSRGIMVDGVDGWDVQSGGESMSANTGFAKEKYYMMAVNGSKC
jgi:hypothetical protein